MGELSLCKPMPILDSGADSAQLTLDTALNLLRRYTCLDRLPAAEIPDRAQTRQALCLVAHHSDYQIFGLCADTLAVAEATLATYLSALGYEEKPSIPPLDGVVYVKFNPKTGRCHSDSYLGQHRGVLIACQSAYDGDVNETFGHLPLDLFAEVEEGSSGLSQPQGS